MQKYKAWLVVAALSPVFPTFAQTASKPIETAHPQHTIVPLSPMSLDGRVSGDPDKPGTPFVIRIPNDVNQIVPPHWHPQDENIVVVKGTWYMGMGEKFDHKALREMNVGDYALVPKGMRHFAWSKTDTIIQVHGIGPFQIIPVDTWDFLGGGKVTPDNPMVQDSRNASLFKFQVSERVRSKRGDGLIVSGLHSKQNNITQYDVQTDDGQRFYETEGELVAVPREKNLEVGPLSGTWDGVIHGLPGGDTSCTFYIQQNKDKVTGVLALPQGGLAFNASTFRNNALELHLDTLVGKFAFNAEFKRGELSGQWSLDSGPKGTWEARKIVMPPKS